MDIVILDNDVIYMCTFIIYSNFYPALYNSIYTTLMLPITMPTDPTSQQLYQEFLQYMKGPNKPLLDQRSQQEYKNMHSELCKANQNKKLRLEGMERKEYGMKSQGCKFTKIVGVRDWATIRDEEVRAESRVLQDGATTDDKILMEEAYSKELHNEIDSYKTQISLKSKQITEVKNKIKLLDLQESKFAQVYHLANNITQFTDQFQIINVRNYNQMLQQQETILTKLRKIKARAKNQLAEMQYLYQLQQREQEMKYKKLMKSCIPLQMDQEQAVKKIGKIPKGYKKFMEAIEKVLELLEEKEENFGAIKQEECTKLTNRKFNTELLPADRVEWVKNIQQFEAKFSMRIESSDKIILKLYKQIKQQNQKIEKTIFENKCLLEDYESQYKNLLLKLSQLQSVDPLSPQSQIFAQKELDQKLTKIRSNSVVFVQLVQVIAGLLVKFRYIFKLFIMMNIDKRKLSDHLLKLDQVLDRKGGFLGNGMAGGGGRLGDGFGNGNGTTGGNVQDTNAAEMCEILGQNFEEEERNFLQEILFIFFNDIRAALVCKKTMIIEQLQQHKEKATLNDMIKILETIRQQCEYNYNEKLKCSLKLLFDCLQCGWKNGQGGLFGSGRSGIAGANGGGSKGNFLNMELYLPAGMFPKVKIVDDEVKEEEMNNNAQETSKWILQYLINNSDKDKPEPWGKEQKKNPSIMIRKLLSIRNESSKKLKLLDLHECQKKYIKTSSKDLLSEAKLQNGTALVKTISSQSKSQEQSQQNVSIKRIREGRSNQASPNNGIGRNKVNSRQFNNFFG